MADPTAFRIPKQTDQSLLNAVCAIRDDLADKLQLQISVTRIQGGMSVVLPPTQNKHEEIAFFLEQHSELFPTIELQLPSQQSPRNVLYIRRVPAEPFDTVTVTSVRDNQNWFNSVAEVERDVILARVIALARKHLKAADADASLARTSDSEWSLYRDSQLGILSALKETHTTLLVESAQKISAAEQSYREKFEELEKRLNDDIRVQREKYQAEHERIKQDHDSREETLKAKVAEFETKEARYVARQQQGDQVKKIEGWIENWTLTKTATQKRWWIHAACLVSGAVFIASTWFFAEQASSIVSKSILPLATWQWAFLILRPIVPFALFAAVSAYYIRWNARWAEQHAEEEFRNRSRILDVGRSQWILEAIRDAQDHDKELPQHLIMELSRNLFSTSHGGTPDEASPQVLGKVLMQGLSSLRVKASDGSEVEAKNEGGKAAK